MLRTLPFFAVVSLLSALAGCSGDSLATYPAGGIVTLDGQPVVGAGVLFMPYDGPAASGTTDAEGRYTLHTLDREGAVEGKHRVMITLMKTSGIEVTGEGLEGELSSGGIKNEYLVPQKYSMVETSGLTAQVGPDTPQHNFELSSK
jgi:hypothetical protein